MRGTLESDEDTIDALKLSFDFILSTIPESHDINPFVQLLKRDSTIVVMGAFDNMKPIDNMEMPMHRKCYGGSHIGSIAETWEVRDFCAEHDIGPDIELIKIQYINHA